MNNQPRTITLINQKTHKRRVIHLITKAKEKSFKFASANCKRWVLNNGFPIIIKVSYGMKQKSKDKIFNDMECTNQNDLDYALQVFVKEYL